MAISTEGDNLGTAAATSAPAPVPVPVSTGPVLTPLPSPVLGGAIGCDFRSLLNQLLFVEYSGKLSRMDLFPAATVVSSGTTILKGTFLFDLDTGTQGGEGPGNDIWWEQETAVARQMTPVNSARILNLGSVNYAALTAAGLQNLPYATTPIPGNDNATNKLVAGDVFAVKTTQGNFAKVLVDAYGYDLTITWTTYQLQPMYAVLGTGYNEPEDVKASADGTHAYVTERTGDLLRVVLTSANRANATVVASRMTAPQQLFLDEAHNAAYTVEYAPSGRLLRIELSTGATTTVLSGLQNAVGVVLSADRQFAYVSEQTTGPDQGRISRFQLSNGQRQPVVTGLTAPFFLTWSDASETVLLVPERDPANRLRSVNVTSGTAVVVAGGLPVQPSSVAVANPGTLLVCCDQVIEEITLASPATQPDGPLLEGIGFIAYQWVTPAGLADSTDADPTYFFQVKDVPFGGSLPVMVNFLRAALDGAAFYQVKVGGVVRTDVFHGEWWNGTEYIPKVFGPQTLNGQQGYYPVPSATDLALWLQPLPGCYLDSTSLASAQLHTITVDFYTAVGALLESATPLAIYVDNNPCTATITEATLNGVQATNACGYLPYNPAAKATDQVQIPFGASQPEGYATYRFSLVKGANQILLSPPVPGPVSGITPANDPIQETVAALLGTCVIAGFAADVYVWAGAITGWARCSQYDASAVEAFVLAPPVPAT